MTIIVKRLGTAVIERDHDVYFVMTPDGQVTCVGSTELAQTLVRKWQRQNTPADGAATMIVDWRGCVAPQ